MRRRIVASVLSALTAIALAAAPSAAAGDGDPDPGYSFSNPPLAPIMAGGFRTTVVQGVHQHSAFDLEFPHDWNGQLVMWAHGYRGEGTVLTVDTPSYGLRQRFVNEGYAWASSSYYHNSYDVRSGVIATHDLALYLPTLLHRKPTRTYIAGVSMGGHVIARSLDQYPKFYSGALPMCGVLGDVRLFDFFTSYNLVAQDLADVHAYPPPADYFSADVPKIEVKLGIAGLGFGQDPTNPLGKELQATTVDLTGGPRPGANASFSVWKDFLFGLYRGENGGSLAQNPGRIAQNATTTYRQTSPVDIQTTVQRVSPRYPTVRSNHRLIQIPRITGDPRVPVLTLHGLGDMFVPFSMEQAYARMVAANGESDLLVQRAVRETGHCEYTPVEAGRAWEDLRHWVETGVRPAGDDVTNPAVVADPNYGCTFTDPDAYNDPTDFPTRALFAHCPTG